MGTIKRKLFSGKYVYINNDGQSTQAYSSIVKCWENENFMKVIIDATKRGEVDQYGLIDNNGNTIIELGTYDNIRVQEKVIYVQKGDKWGALDLQGNTILDCIYSDVTFDDQHNLFVIKNDKGLSGVANTNGEIIINCEHKKLVIANKDVVISGNQALPLTNKYDMVKIIDILDSNDIKDYKFVVSKDGKLGVINSDGTTIAKCDYDDLQLSKNFVHLCKAGKWGLSEINGNPLLPCKYSVKEGQRGFDICKGLAFIKDELTGKYACVSIETGKRVTKFAYDDYFINIRGDIKVYQTNPTDKNLETRTKCGLLNEKGQEIVPCAYYDVYQLNGTFACVQHGSRSSLNDDVSLYNITTGKEGLRTYRSLGYENGHIVGKVGGSDYYEILNGNTGEMVAMGDHSTLKNLSKDVPGSGR